jgi:cytochrome c553
MKRKTFFVACMAVFGLGLYFFADSGSFHGLAQEKQVTTIPETIVLGKDAKLGSVTFNHGNHISKNYTVDGTGQIKCIECHHVAQPSSEAAKHPPLKTSWPADRTTTLTAELFTKDPAAAGVVGCRSCHARTGEVPKLIPKIPEVKLETSTTALTVNNMQAFHRTCAACHNEVVKARPTAKAPTANQCTACHKKTA